MVPNCHRNVELSPEVWQGMGVVTSFRAVMGSSKSMCRSHKSVGSQAIKVWGGTQRAVLPVGLK